jgi:hypothetical protein
MFSASAFVSNISIPGKPGFTEHVEIVDRQSEAAMVDTHILEVHTAADDSDASSVSSPGGMTFSENAASAHSDLTETSLDDLQDVPLGSPAKQDSASLFEKYRSPEFNFTKSWVEKDENIIRKPYDYLSSQPGKNVRAMLLAAFNQFLKVEPAHLEIITNVISMLHNASLL